MNNIFYRFISKYDIDRLFFAITKNGMPSIFYEIKHDDNDYYSELLFSGKEYNAEDLYFITNLHDFINQTDALSYGNVRRVYLECHEEYLANYFMDIQEIVFDHENILQDTELNHNMTEAEKAEFFRVYDGFRNLYDGLSKKLTMKKTD